MTDTPSPFRTMGEAFGGSDSHSYSPPTPETSYPLPPKQPTVKHNRLEKFIGRIGWLVVVSAALTLSTWSLFYVGRHYGLPIPLAAIVSAAFDGAAICCADLALKYARTHGDSGLAPRLCVLLLAATSAYLNSQHAVLAHDPNPARILYAVPPIIAVTLFELHNRYERRTALRRAGRVAKSLPVFGRWSWVLFPARTLGMMRRVVAYRLNQAVSDVPMEDIGITPQRLRLWARMKGIEVADNGRIPAHVLTAYRAEVAAESGILNGHAKELS